MEKYKQSAGPALILLAGCFWGSMGLFVRRLGAFGFSSSQIVCIRLTLAALVFCGLLLARERAGFGIPLRDLPLFLGLGFGSILFFTVCYFTAITMMPLSTAAILLYTSPIWVTLLSALLFHEKLDAAKLTALCMAFGGCVLVSGLGGGGLTLRGLLLGLGAGLGYGLYSILGSIALRRYSPFTVTAWTFLIAGIGALSICRPAQMLALIGAGVSPALTVLFFLLTAVVTAFIPFLSYTLGLRSVEAGKAAILATVEPMVASLLGVVVFREALSLSAALGILLILGAIVLLSLPKK